MKPAACTASLLLVFSLIFPLSANAQSSRKNYSPDQSFIAGFAPISLLTRSGKFNLRSEWAYTDNKSLSILVGIPRRSNLPGWLASDIDVNENGQITTNDFRSFALIIENRFYLGAGAPHGFYIAPYARYNRIWLTHTSAHPDVPGEIRITGAIGGTGLGAAAGWQFPLGDHMTLDVTFLGIDFKWFRGTLNYTDTNPENDLEAFRAKVEKTVQDIPLIGSHLTPTIENNSVKVHTPGWILPALRFNLTVGYAF